MNLWKEQRDDAVDYTTTTIATCFKSRAFTKKEFLHFRFLHWKLFPQSVQMTASN